METYKILIVDDNAENSDRIREFLSEDDKSLLFFQALNGKIAGSIAEKSYPI